MGDVLKEALRSKRINSKGVLTCIKGRNEVCLCYTLHTVLYKLSALPQAALIDLTALHTYLDRCHVTASLMFVWGSQCALVNLHASE